MKRKGVIGGKLNERYLIEGELGRGGMGVVYRGRDLLLERPVAVKLVEPGVLGTEGRARLLREARAAARLNQPNILAVYDAGESTLPGQEGQAAFVVMELVAGRTLRGYRPGEVAEAVNILEQICAALAAAHAVGIVHRDLKPENVMLTDSGYVKLMDFGLAFVTDGPRLTQEGTFLGTFDYLAPEVIQGKEAGVGSDLYALGVMAYELLAGRRPFEGDTPAAVLSMHLHAPATPPCAYNPAVPPTLEALVVRLLSKMPEHRPGSAAEVREALLDITAAPQAAEFVPSGPRLDFLVRGRLVGRENELAKAMAFWRRAAGGERQVLLVSGEPGIGKTRLATEIGVQAQLSGARLLKGRCFEHGGLPYMPVAQMIRAVFEDGEPPTLPSTVMVDLGWLAPGLDVAEAQIKEQQAAPEEEDEGRLYESFVSLCKVIVQEQPLVLFVDDLHWADSGTMAIIRHLTRRLPSAPIMILVTYREIELTGRRPARELLSDLRRESGAVRLKLGRLDRAETKTLLATLFHEEITAEFLEAIYAETEGNPFFVEELSKALVASGELTFEDGQWRRPAMAEIRLPQSIQLTIESRLGKLDEETLEALRAAAMLGREFRYDWLRATTGLAEATLVEALDGAIRGQLIEESASAASGRTQGPSFAFSHALIQTTLLNGMGGLRRRLLAGQLAAALEESFAGEQTKMTAQLGRLYSEAGNGAKAVPYLLRAGDEARQLFAYDEAIAWYEQALLFLREGEDPDLTARTLMTCGATCMKAAQFDRARRAYDEGFVLWRRAPHLRTGMSLEEWAGRLFRTHAGEPMTLDPSRVFELDSQYVVEQLFEGLVELGMDDELLPAAAASWEIQEGGRRYVFHLHDGATWSDGRPVTAADFAFSWKRLLTPGINPRAASIFFDVQGARSLHLGHREDATQVGIRAANPSTLVVDLEEPVAYFLHLIASTAGLPVPRHVVEERGDRWTEHMVSNGPFTLARWAPGREIVLTRNAKYSGRFGGNLEQVELSLANDAWLLEAYAADRLDCLYLNLVGKTGRTFSSDLLTTPSLRTSFLAFDCGRQPFDDARVRRAFALAIDVQEYANNVLAGRHHPATSGIIPPGIAGHGLGSKRRFDPLAARQLLAEAGYPGGRGFPKTALYMSVAAVIEGVFPAEWIVRQWADNLDLDIEWHDVTMAEMFDQLEQGRPKIWSQGFAADYTDPDSLMRAPDWPGTCHWQNDEFVRLVKDARAERNQARRLALYRRAEAILAEEAPIVPLVYVRWQILVKPWVRRFAMSPTVRTIFKDVVVNN